MFLRFFRQPVSQQLQYKAAVEAQIIMLAALKGKNRSDSLGCMNISKWLDAVCYSVGR